LLTRAAAAVVVGLAGHPQVRTIEPAARQARADQVNLN
jgi:hypothetical protein